MNKSTRCASSQTKLFKLYLSDCSSTRKVVASLIFFKCRQSSYCLFYLIFNPHVHCTMVHIIYTYKVDSFSCHALGKTSIWGNSTFHLRMAQANRSSARFKERVWNRVSVFLHLSHLMWMSQPFGLKRSLCSAEQCILTIPYSPHAGPIPKMLKIDNPWISAKHAPTWERARARQLLKIEEKEFAFAWFWTAM